MPNVYVVNQGCHDYSKAEEFGKLVFLSEVSMDRFDTSKIWRKFHPVLSHASNKDWILLSGLTVMSLIASGILIAKFGKLNLLIYRNTKKGPEYVPQVIVFGKESDGSTGESSKHNVLGPTIGDLRKKVMGKEKKR